MSKEQEIVQANVNRKTSRIRSEAQQDYFANNPGKGATRVEAMNQRRKEAYAERAKEMLGDDPRGRLEEVYLKGKLTKEQTAKKLGVSVNVLTTLLKNFEVKKHSRRLRQTTRLNAEYASIAQEAAEKGFLNHLPSPLWEIICLRYLSHATVTREALVKDLNQSLQ